jgi:DNA-binding MarR family transcriptional regulator
MMPRVTKTERELDAVMAASRALVAIVARSFAEADVAITLQQWRVLVVVAHFGPLSPGELAKWLAVHKSNATRMCDALVGAGLLDRREDPDNRRRMVLSLTADGEAVVDSLQAYRRQAIATILDQVPPRRRGQVAEAMQAFADAAGDRPEHYCS